MEYKFSPMIKTKNVQGDNGEREKKLCDCCVIRWYCLLLIYGIKILNPQYTDWLLMGEILSALFGMGIL